MYTMPAVAATPLASTVTPEMFTVTGSVLLPITAMITPLPSRRSGSSAAIRLSPTWRGSIVTRSAPAPRSVRFLLIVSTDVPCSPGPSAYVPGQIEMVSPAARVANRVADPEIPRARTARALLADDQRRRRAARLALCACPFHRKRRHGGHNHQHQLASHRALPSSSDPVVRFYSSVSVRVKAGSRYLGLAWRGVRAV